jgi:glycosyltransferase involved in cell wall biosynthesis
MVKTLMVALYPIDSGKIKGGVEAVSVNLVKGFIPVSGIELKIFAPDRNIKNDQTEKLTESISIHHISYGKIKSTKYALFFHLRKRLKQFIEEFNPDIIHIQGNGSQLLLTYNINKNKIVITQHAILIEEFKTQSTLASKLNFMVNMCIELVMMPRIKNHIFISDYNKKLLGRPISSLNKAALIYNPVNPTFFDIETNDKPINRLIYIGGIMKRKGLLDLLQTLKALIDQGINFRLDIVGGIVEANYSEKINEFIIDNSLTSNVVFHGWLSQQQITKLYQQVQILVLPSYQETLPVCISEALAAGRVVVATNVGGVAEMIENGKSGYLYEKGDIKTLTYILSDLYLNTNLYHSISAQARKSALQKYSPVNIAEQTLHFYKQIADL